MTDLTLVPSATPAVPAEPETIENEIENLARDLIKKAKEKDVSFTDKLDAFKALSTYHVNILKAQGKLKPGSDDDGEASLKGAKARIQNAQ